MEKKGAVELTQSWHGRGDVSTSKGVRKGYFGDSATQEKPPAGFPGEILETQRDAD